MVDNGLFGSWAGLKPYLRDRGIDLGAMFTAELATNIQGGVRERAATAKQWALSLDGDMEKLVGLRHGRFHIAISKRAGHKLEDSVDLPTLQASQELYGRGSVWRMAEGWYEQDIDKLTLRVGRLSLGNEFTKTPCIFQNLGLCGPQPGNTTSDLWYTWPVSQWGLRLVYNIRPDLLFETGMYAVNTKNTAKLNMYFDNPFHPRAGLFPFQLQWSPAFGPRHGLKGIYELGGWYSNDTAPDLQRQPDGSLLDERTGRWGVYANTDQLLYHDAKGRALDLFVRAMRADNRTELIEGTTSIALIWTGITSARPRDSVGVGFGAIWLSTPFLKSRVPSSLGRNHEFFSEIFYSFSLSSWAFLRPNFQFYGQPGGYKDRAPFIVGGLKTSMTF